MNGWPSPLLAAQAEYLEHLGTTPSAEVRRDGGVYAVCTGAASNTENGVLGDDAAQVEELVAWFRERKAPATWLCRGDSAAETLVAAGCRPERESWEMRARLADLELRAAPTGVERVRSVESVATWFDLAERNGWFGDSSERAPFERLYGELALRDDARVALYLKRVDGEAAAFASAFYGESTVLLTQVVVVEALQRRGIGSALAYTRLREAKERGCELAVLAPAPDGVPFYTALGFELRRSPPDRWFYLPCGPS